ncbi:MAG: fibronectin type III domain-containing protein, partial [Armatimonadota bacterium]
NIYINCTRGSSSIGTMWVDDISFVDETTGDELFVGGGFEDDRIDYDTALAVKKYGVLLNNYGKSIGKPTMMGESGIRGENVYGAIYKDMGYSEENQQLVDDTNGINLKKIIWAHAGPDIPYMMLWWTECIDYNNIWYYFKALSNFMAGISLSNGKYRDARAIVSNPGMRAWGQKSITDACAYLWIDNTKYTWKNIVDGNIPATVSGTVTVSGLPAGSYTVEWWDTSTGMITTTGSAQSVGGNLVLNVNNLVSDVACKIYPINNAAPSAPTNLTPSNILADSIGLTWVDTSTNETGVKVEVSTNGYSGPWTNVVNLSTGTTACNISALAPQTSYVFQVKAYNSNGDSAPSNQVSITTPSAQVTSPSTSVAAPSNAVAVASKLSSEMPTVTIIWNDNSNNETGFLIQRAVNGDWNTNVKKFYVPANSTTFVDDTVTIATRYKYIIQAYNNTLFSSTFYLKAVCTPGQLPLAPANVQATTLSNSSINIDWDASLITSEYKVYRSTAGPTGPWQRISILQPPITEYTNTGLSKNKQYWYMVLAINQYGVSTNPNVATATTLQ